MNIAEKASVFKTNTAYMYISEARDAKDFDSQAEACLLLGNKKEAKRNPKVIKVLIEALNSEYSLTRANSAKSLGKLEAKEACEKLKEHLNDSFLLAVKNSIIALARLRDENAIPALMEHVSNNKHAAINHIAAKAISEICINSQSEICKRALESVEIFRDREFRDYESRNRDSRGGGFGTREDFDRHYDRYYDFDREYSEGEFKVKGYNFREALEN